MKENTYSSNGYLSFEQAKAHIHSLQLKTYQEWVQFQCSHKDKFLTKSAPTGAGKGITKLSDSNG
jgi:hypothetical protein